MASAFSPTVLDRRRLLQTAGLGCFGLSLARLMQPRTASAAEPSVPRSASTIQSCILLYYYGGPSHIDIQVMEPSAPAENRGGFCPSVTPPLSPFAS